MEQNENSQTLVNEETKRETTHSNADKKAYFKLSKKDKRLLLGEITRRSNSIKL